TYKHYTFTLTLSAPSNKFRSLYLKNGLELMLFLRYSINKIQYFYCLTIAMDYHDLIALAIAFGLGLLVGLQRQKSDHEMAGVRTFTLISIMGVISAFLARDYGNPYIIPVFGMCLTALLVTANIIKVKNLNDNDIGQTTEVAA